MKRRQALNLITLATLVPLLHPALAAAPLRGQPVVWPEVALLDGGHFGAATAAGQAVVVVFWSTTCPFCRRHNQHLEKLQRAAAGLPLKVLAVARERDAARVRRYAAQQGYSFPITLEHAPLADALSARKLIPLTVTVDRLGLLQQVYPGEMFEEDVLDLRRLAQPATEKVRP